MSKNDCISIKTIEDERGNVITKKTKTIVYYPNIDNVISHLKKAEGRIEKVEIVEVDKPTKKMQAAQRMYELFRKRKSGK